MTRLVYQAGQERAFSKIERTAAALAAGSAQTVRAGPLADPLLLGRIEIPRLDLTAIVREGDDDATLAVAVGHIPGTAKPGERGNVVLAGHRDTFFRALRGIRLHDTIRISTPRGEDEYSVVSTEVVGPKEIRVLRSTGDGRLTLVTCFPFGFVGRAPRRFVVRASLTPK
jgi:sortase A